MCATGLSFTGKDQADAAGIPQRLPSYYGAPLKFQRRNRLFIHAFKSHGHPPYSSFPRLWGKRLSGNPGKIASPSYACPSVDSGILSAAAEFASRRLAGQPERHIYIDSKDLASLNPQGRAKFSEGALALPRIWRVVRYGARSGHNYSRIILRGPLRHNINIHTLIDAMTMEFYN